MLPTLTRISLPILLCLMVACGSGDTPEPSDSYDGIKTPVKSQQEEVINDPVVVETVPNVTSGDENRDFATKATDKGDRIESGTDLSDVNDLVGQDYDRRCVDTTLSFEMAKELFFEDRPPSNVELQKIEHCRFGAQNGMMGYEFELGCVDNILGVRIADELLNERPPTSGELEKIEGCRPGSNDDSNYQNEEDGKSVVVSPPSDQKTLLADWGPQALCEGSDKDDHGLAIGPQCNLVPDPLPSGVTKGTLISAKLPDPKYGVPLEDCQIFQGDYCSELQWAKTSDLQAGEFVQIRISQTNPNVMYAGTDSNDMSTYRSTDAGNTWELVHVKGHVAGIAVSPIDSNIVLYTNLEAPVQRTNDGGKSWSPVVGNEPGSVEYNKPFTAISFSEDHPNVVYTSALRGSSRGGIWPPEPSDIFKSIDSGVTWNQMGTCETCSSIQTIVVKKGDPNFIWVSADGGLQYSKDSGKTWSGNVIPYLRKVAEQQLQNRIANMPKVIGLTIHPDRPDIILAASSEFGMFRSVDGGVSWEHSNAGLKTSKLHQVYFAPSNPNVAYLSTHDGLYRSDDGGESWAERNKGLKHKFLSPIAIHPNNENVVFVGTTSEIYTIHPEHMNKGFHDGHGIYKSADGGMQWERSDANIVEAKPAQIGTHPLLPFNIWVGGESGRGNLFSPDGGDSWLFTPSVTAHYPMVYAFNNELPTVIYTTGWLKTGELTTSTDGGASWYTLTHKLNEGLSDKTIELGLRGDGPSDFHIHGLAVAPSDPNVIYVGSVHDAVYTELDFNLDGAHIWKSSDRGETFPEMSNGFPIETKTSINAIVVHPRDPDTAYAMTTLHETETAIGIYKTTNGAQTWIAVNNGLDVFTNDLQMDPINPDILYAATESGVYKTTNGGQTWGKASRGIPKGAVIDMAIDPLNPLVIYAITPENIFRTRDGADHWYPVNLGISLLPESSMTLSAQERLFQELKLDRTKTGHSMYGGTFAQDRTLEIDATGTLIVVTSKTDRSDADRRNERILYRAALTPLVNVNYEFSINDPQSGVTDARVGVTSQSNIYDMVFDSNLQEIKFVAAGPLNTETKTTVLLPSNLLSGGGHSLDCCIKVFIDGREVPSSNTGDGITFDHVHVGRSDVVIKTS